ncbi:MAG: hypothetical protein V1723_01730 [Candidatus Uhrbacteria bacterium]
MPEISPALLRALPIGLDELRVVELRPLRRATRRRDALTERVADADGDRATDYREEHGPEDRPQHRDHKGNCSHRSPPDCGCDG